MRAHRLLAVHVERPSLKQLHASAGPMHLQRWALHAELVLCLQAGSLCACRCLWGASAASRLTSTPLAVCMLVSAFAARVGCPLTFGCAVLLWEIATTEMPERGNLRDVRVPEETCLDIEILITRCL